MKRTYLEVTFRKGKAVAAYLYLPRLPNAKAARTVELRPTVLVDYSATGEPIGLELTAPSGVDVSLVNSVLLEIGIAQIDGSDLAPLRAA